MPTPTTPETLAQEVVKQMSTVPPKAAWGGGAAGAASSLPLVFVLAWVLHDSYQEHAEAAERLTEQLRALESAVAECRADQ